MTRLPSYKFQASNLGQHLPKSQTYQKIIWLRKHTHFYLLDAQNPETKMFCDTVGHSLFFFQFGPKAPGAHEAHGPRPLGPIGPIFRRTITVTGKVQFLEGPRISFKYEKCFRRKCTPAGKVDRIYPAINMAIALFRKPLEKMKINAHICTTETWYFP